MESRAKSRPLRNRSDQRIWSLSQCRCLTMHIELRAIFHMPLERHLILDLYNVCCTQPGVAIGILMQQVDCANKFAGWTVDWGSPRQISELWVLILHFAPLLYLYSYFHLYIVFEVSTKRVVVSEGRSVFVFCNIYTFVFLYSVSCICILIFVIVICWEEVSTGRVGVRGGGRSIIDRSLSYSSSPPALLRSTVSSVRLPSSSYLPPTTFQQIWIAFTFHFSQSQSILILTLWL